MNAKTKMATLRRIYRLQRVQLSDADLAALAGYINPVDNLGLYTLRRSGTLELHRLFRQFPEEAMQGR